LIAPLVSSNCSRISINSLQLIITFMLKSKSNHIYALYQDNITFILYKICYIITFILYKICYIITILYKICYIITLSCIRCVT
jgi:hypothetical protein